jgi:hypothetical protein
LNNFKKLHDLHKEWLIIPHPNVPSQVLVLGADKDISLYPQLTKSILKEGQTISVNPKICKDVGSELELLDCKILTPTIEFGRAIFHEILRHNSTARPGGAHTDLQNVSNHVEPKDTPFPLLLKTLSTKPTRKLGCLS